MQSWQKGAVVLTGAVEEGRTFSGRKGRGSSKQKPSLQRHKHRGHGELGTHSASQGREKRTVQVGR